MNNKEYRERGAALWLLPKHGCTECDSERQLNMTHMLFGLQTETAELTDYFKKLWFTPKRSKLDHNYIRDELGDILYYLDRMAEARGYHLWELMDANIEKLEKRYPSLDEG
jgi:NTP pyrophosphatase (non-canonical NTP hydrolase)